MLTADERNKILRSTTLFAKVPDTILAQVAAAMTEVSVLAGEIIFEKGDTSTSMYIIARGQVQVHDGKWVLNHLGQGEVFGEMAALDPDVRSASITAEVDTTLFRLDQEFLLDLMSKEEDALRAIIHTLSQHLRARSRDLVRDFEHREALERELEIGREIQASFLPEKLPLRPGWEFAAHFQAAREVAGDFYDVFPLTGNERIGLVVGDVCDKGVGAALFMTLFRSLIRASATSDILLCPESASPADGDAHAARLKESITLTNDYIASTHSQTSMFATLFFALLHPSSGSLLYVNGGHEAPLILGPTGVRTRLERTGPAVGLFPNMEFEVKEARLEPGETLLAFSDGVTEAMDQGGQLFGEERLLSLLVGADLSAAALLSRIGASLDDHTAGTGQSDDITMLAVRRSPSPTTGE
jgi:serine phosphatase RsbU (regulator of sigma subunit)